MALGASLVSAATLNATVDIGTFTARDKATAGYTPTIHYYPAPPYGIEKPFPFTGDYVLNFTFELTDDAYVGGSLIRGVDGLNSITFYDGTPSGGLSDPVPSYHVPGNAAWHVGYGSTSMLNAGAHTVTFAGTTTAGLSGLSFWVITSPTVPVPEPSTALLLAAGAAAIALYRRRQAN